MTVSIGQPGDYDLVSARDGGDVPASYGPPPVQTPGSEPGSRRLPRRRDFGRRAEGRLPHRRPDRPPGERRRRRAGGADLGPRPGGELDDPGHRQTRPGHRRDDVGSGRGRLRRRPQRRRDARWLGPGGNAGEQTRFLGGETPDPSFPFYLWRRVADGPAAPTRRITGLADPDDPACPPGSSSFFDQTSTGPCFGPLTDQEANRTSISGQLPAISADGRTVAFLTGRRATAAGLDRSRARPLPHRHGHRSDPQGGDRGADPRHGRDRRRHRLAAGQRRDLGRREATWR